jgi:hypothetical protein
MILRAPPSPPRSLQRLQASNPPSLQASKPPKPPCLNRGRLIEKSPPQRTAPGATPCLSTATTS